MLWGFGSRVHLSLLRSWRHHVGDCDKFAARERMRTRNFDEISQYPRCRSCHQYYTGPSLDLQVHGGAGVEEDLADWAGGCDWRRKADRWRRYPIGTLSSSERV